MTIQDRVGEYEEIENMHDGKGKTLAYRFFKETLDKSMWFFEITVKPGDYAGHHRHKGNVEIIYILSGKMENFQDGKSDILGPGDAILIKSGESHVVKNIGEDDLKALGFVAKPGDDIGSIENLPLPERIVDWAT